MSLKSRMRTATDTTLRHLAMLTAIPIRPHSKSTRRIREELRDRNPDFDVTLRSIQRSLERLSELFPITSERRGTANYWHWIERDALTQIPAMSTTTAFVLCLAAEYLRPIMPPSALPKLEPYSATPRTSSMARPWDAGRTGRPSSRRGRRSCRRKSQPMCRKRFTRR